ncbi:MAG: hypothetical protein WBG11_14090 [Methylocella sp.]
MKTNEWVTIKNQSLAVYTREAGFDLSIYNEYSAPVQAQLRKRAIDAAMFGISNAFEEQNIDIYDIKKGIYVISLSAPLTILYRTKRSQVIYIGIGNVMGRVKQHFEGSLFDFMQSLSGANFDFSFACPEMDGHDLYYKHVEWEMLEHFSKQYGGVDDNRRFPLLNKNAGSNKGIENDSDWWKKPLKNTGKQPRWHLSPTEYSEFATLD